MPTEQEMANILAAYDETQHDLGIFMDGIRKWFDEHRRLRCPHSSIVHSVKCRLKDRDHLREKVQRKSGEDGEAINSDNIFKKITDLAGVRVLHLYQDQFPDIHAAIRDKIERQKDWVLNEPPKAYVFRKARHWCRAKGKLLHECALRCQTEGRFSTLLRNSSAHLVRGNLGASGPHTKLPHQLRKPSMQGAVEGAGEISGSWESTGRLYF